MERINVTRSSMPPYEEYCNEIKTIWDTAHLTNMGALHKRLEAEVAEYLKTEHALLFNNGHITLYCILKAMELQGEIITTPFTFTSTVNAIVQAGCIPVFCDVKPDYTIDETKIEKLITEKTSAILGVHVYGNVCAVDEIQRVAEKYHLKVIYDAAHAFGVEYLRRGIGTFGDASMFSFHATKVFHTIEGGCATYQDASLGDALELQRNHGICGETLKCVGMNGKMNEFQAAMGLCNLRHLKEELSARSAAYERYSQCLANVKGIRLPPVNKNITTENYSYYPILVDTEQYGESRDKLAERLNLHNVFPRKYFFPLASENETFEKGLAEQTPYAKMYSRNILCLPLYAHIDLKDIDYICNIIAKK